MSKKNIGSTVGVLAAVTIGATAYASTMNNLDKEDQSKKVLDNNVSYIDQDYASKVKVEKKDFANEVSNTKFAEKSKSNKKEDVKNEKISKSRNLADPEIFESSSEEAIVKAIDEKIESNKIEDKANDENTVNNALDVEEVEPVIEEQVVEKYVAVDSLNVRSSKTDQENNIVDILNKNTGVSGTIEDGWLKTEKGYIKLDFLADQPVEEVVASKDNEEVTAEEPQEEATKTQEEEAEEKAKKAQEEARKAEEKKVEEEAKKVQEEKVAREEAKKEVQEAKAKEENNQVVYYTGWVSADVLNVRNSGNMDSNLLGSVRKGEKLSGELQNGWLKISYNGQVGYVSSDFLSDTEIKKPVIKKEVKEEKTPAPVNENKVQQENQSQAYTGWVNTPALNVRSGASTSYNIIGNYSKGDKVSGQLANGWLKVDYNGQTGYISANLLSDTEVEKAQPVVENTRDNNIQENNNNNNVIAQQASVQRPQVSGNGQAAANIASSMLGQPYVWGGTAPGGFDCSGLIQYVYKQLGVNLARTTYGQAGNGYAVNVNSVQAGDILLFSYNGSIDHVGIVTDSSGNFVHASNPSTGVCTGNIYDPWYSSVCAGVRRIF